HGESRREGWRPAPRGSRAGPRSHPRAARDERVLRAGARRPRRGPIASVAPDARPELAERRAPPACGRPFVAGLGTEPARRVLAGIPKRGFSNRVPTEAPAAEAERADAPESERGVRAHRDAGRRRVRPPAVPWCGCAERERAR